MARRGSIGAMDEAGAITGAEFIEVVQGGVNKKATLDNGAGRPLVLDPATGKIPPTKQDATTAGLPARVSSLEAFEGSADPRLDALEAAQAGSMIGFTTKALMDADLAWDAGVLARVTNDDVDAANNGVYIKLGATGTGSWQQSDDEISVLAGQIAGLEDADEELEDRIVAVEDSGATDLPGMLDEAGLRNSVEGGTRHPLVVDQDGRVLLYFDEVESRFFVHGVSGPLDLLGDLRGDMDLAGMRRYVGSGPVYPILADADGRVLLGYDAESNEMVGLALGGGGTAFPIVKEVNHILFFGQSLSIGATATTLLSTSQPYSNITFSGGPRTEIPGETDYSSFKPLVESVNGVNNRGETPCSGAANYATRLAAKENGVLPEDHVILASTAGHGGYSITQLNKAAAWYSVLEAHIANAVTLNNDYALHAIAWMQGENDAGDSMPFATYRDHLETLQADIDETARGISGQRSPVWLLTYQLSVRSATWPDIALAQLDLCQKNDRFALASPMYHMPYSDGTHLTNVGYKWIGAYFGRAYKQLVHDQRKPDWLNPVSAILDGAEIRVRFDVPTAPLVLDTTTLAATTDHGFRVVDSGGTVAISSITIDGDEIVLALGATPSGDTVVRYALDHQGTGLTHGNGASGNLRDSTPETVVIDGVARPLYHVCPHFQLTATPHQEI